MKPRSPRTKPLKQRYSDYSGRGCCECSPSDEVSRTGGSAFSQTTPAAAAAAAGNNVNFKRGIVYRTTISGSTVKDRRANAAPARTGTFAVPADNNDVSSISHGSGAGTGGRGLSFFDKLTSKFSRRYMHTFCCIVISSSLELCSWRGGLSRRSTTVNSTPPLISECVVGV